MRRALAAFGLCAATACSQSAPRGPDQQGVTLRIGFGSVNGQTAQSGLRQQVRLLELDPLIHFGRDARPLPWLAERWSWSPDGLRWLIHLREHVTFQDGKPMNADAVARFLRRELPEYLGPSSQNIESIEAVSEHDLQFTLKRPNAFLLDGLDLAVEDPDTKAGTGPYILSDTAEGLELRANPNYYAGRPLIDRIIVKPYNSTRAAWAEMLRGEVDMVYEVGADALDSLQPSSAVKIFSRLRNYSYVVVLNLHRPQLVSSDVRRRLNTAIDRTTLVSEGLHGHGLPADSPIWPMHWAHDETAPRFGYHPTRLAKPLVLTCLFADPSLERLAIVVQRQLAAIGVDFRLELVSIDEWYKRANSGDFDAILADAAQGPMLFWPSRFWRSDAPFNWGHYKNPKVDGAIDAIREATNDEQYRRGVSAYERAMIDDPPAIFLAWSERSRAVSTRFEVTVSPDRDILSTLRLWKPVGGQPKLH